MSSSTLSDFKALQPFNGLSELDLTPQVEVSLVIPARNASQTLETTIDDAHSFLQQRYGQLFEIILVPNPAPDDLMDPSIQIAEKLTEKFKEVRSCPHLFPPGKGAAIRTGLKNSRGKWILFTDSDLPYDLDFFDSAVLQLKQGFDLVTGNRRLPSSYFNIPVELLRLAYGRHRLGLGFNRLVRWLLPIRTTDTQAGIKALSRRLAQKVCLTQACPGFLFDLEIFLTAHAQNLKQTEFPVTLYLNSEKTTIRILRECILVAFWITRIKWRNHMKVYGKIPGFSKRILTRYRQASLPTRLFLSARWRLTPYSRMTSRLPERGIILDVGCGHGLFSLAAGLHSPTREVIGIDHDTHRVTLGSLAVQDLPNIHIQNGNISHLPKGTKPYSGIAMIDVMHYFDPPTQEELIQKAFDLLEPGGTLLVREVDPQSGIQSKWNRFYERMATRIGFTQSEKKELHFRTQSEWKELIQKSGFKVNSEPCSNLLFADILYTCERLH